MSTKVQGTKPQQKLGAKEVKVKEAFPLISTSLNMQSYFRTNIYEYHSVIQCVSTQINKTTAKENRKCSCVWLAGFTFK